MDSFDKNMNERFSSQDGADLPAGYGWDENADAIYEKMGSQQTEDRRPVYIWWLLGIVLVAAIAGVLWLSDSTEATVELAGEGTTPSSEIAKSTTNKGQAADRVETLAASTKPSASRPIEKNSAAESAAEDINKTSTPTIAISIQSPSLGKDSSEKTLLSTKEKNDITKVDAPSSGRRDLDIQPLDTMPATATAAVGMGAERAGRSLVMVSPVSPLALFTLEQRTRALSVPHAAMLPVDNQRYSRQVTHGLMLRGGTLLAAGGYGGAPIRSEFSHWLPGYHTGVDYQLSTSDRWTYTASYGYSMAVQLFDFKSEDMVVVDKDDVVTRVVTNALTRRTTEITEDLSLPAQRVRDYTTYNTYRSHAIGLMAARQILPTDSKWQISLGLGARYSFLRASAGYTLDQQNEIIDYTADQELYTTSSIDILTELSIGRTLTKHYMVSTYMRAHQSLSDWSTEPTVTYRPMLIEVGVGVMYIWGR